MSERVEMTDTHRQNLRLQAEEHPLVEDRTFSSIEEYVVHLIHRKTYEEAAKVCAGKSVLDWGCNVGYGLQVLQSSAASVAGLDISPRAVEAARKRLGSATVDIRHYDGARCSFPDASFDVVTSFQVVEHISDYDTYFDEILRVLRPSGFLLLSTPNRALRLAPGMKPWNEFHVREFAPMELREFLGRWFALVEVRGLFGIGELDKIERCRVESAKLSALGSGNRRSVLAAVRQSLKNNMPWLANLRRRLRAKRPDAAALAQFSTRELYFKADGLEDALDLLAVCHKE